MSSHAKSRTRRASKKSSEQNESGPGATPGDQHLTNVNDSISEHYNADQDRKAIANLLSLGRVDASETRETPSTVFQGSAEGALSTVGVTSPDIDQPIELDGSPTWEITPIGQSPYQSATNVVGLHSSYQVISQASTSQVESLALPEELFSTQGDVQARKWLKDLCAGG